MPANRLQKSAVMGIEAPCKIYDVYQRDLTKKLIKECESRSEAATFLQLKSSAHITGIIKRKGHHSSKVLGKVITIR